MTGISDIDTPSDTAPRDADRWVTAQVAAGLRIGVAARSHRLAVDEPIGLGGTDTGMTPYELLLASLSSCMVMTMRMYADRKGWPLDGAEVHLRTAPSRDPDRDVRITGAPVGLTRIERRVALSGPLTESQRARIVEIGDRCPVKRTLEGSLHVVPAAEDS